MGDPLYHAPCCPTSKTLRAAIVTLLFLLLAAVASAHHPDRDLEERRTDRAAEYEYGVEVCLGTWIARNNWGEHSPFRPGGWHILNRFGCHIQWHGTVQEAEAAAMTRCFRTGQLNYGIPVPSAAPPLKVEWWGNPVPPEVH